MNHLKQNNQKGFTLVEILLVLGFVAAIFVGIFAAYPAVRTSNQVNAESRNISTIAAGVSTLYTSASTYTGLAAPLLITAKLAPQSMVSGTALNNVWGGAVTVGPTDSNNASPGTAQFYYINYTNLPTDACIKLASSVSGNFALVIHAAPGTAPSAANASKQYGGTFVLGTAVGAPGVNGCSNTNTTQITFINK